MFRIFNWISNIFVHQLENAVKYCATEGHKLESRSLLGLANISLSLLKQSPLALKLALLNDHTAAVEHGKSIETREKRRNSLIDTILPKHLFKQIQSIVEESHHPVDMIDHKKMKRHLINVSALQESSSEIMTESTKRKREQRDDNGPSPLQKVNEMGF